MHFLLLLALGFSFVAQADPAAGVCGTVTRKVQAYLSSISIEMSLITSIGRDVANSGNNHLGVYEVQTAEGRRALKVTWESRDAASMVIQNAMAEEGLAPRLYGILSADSLRAAAPRFLAADKDALPHLMGGGELMDFIPDAWHVTEVTPVPDSAVRWNLPAILARIDHMEKRLFEKNISLVDPQVVIDGNGVAYLIDFDGARVKRGGVGRNQLKWVKERMLSKWAQKFGDPAKN